MTEDLQARLGQAHGKRMSDAAFAKIYPLACEFLSAGSGVSEPLIMLELKRARASETALRSAMNRLRNAAEFLREKAETIPPRMRSPDEQELLDACAEAEAAKEQPR